MFNVTSVSSNVILRFAQLATGPNLESSDFTGSLKDQSEMTLSGMSSDPNNAVKVWLWFSWDWQKKQILKVLGCRFVRRSSCNTLAWIFQLPNMHLLIKSNFCENYERHHDVKYWYLGIQLCTCIMLIKLYNIKWDSTSECPHNCCAPRTNKKLSGFYCRSVYTFLAWIVLLKVNAIKQVSCTTNINDATTSNQISY